MSQYFQVGDRILWNPSNGVAALFIRMADVLSEIAERPTGIHDTGADEHEVDPFAFGAFVEELTRRYLSTSHVIMRSLLEGFLTTALVLADRADLTIAALWQSPVLDPRDVSVGPLGIGQLGDAARLRELAAAQARAMPR